MRLLLAFLLLLLLVFFLCVCVPVCVCVVCSSITVSLWLCAPTHVFASPLLQIDFTSSLSTLVLEKKLPAMSSPGKSNDANPLNFVNQVRPMNTCDNNKELSGSMRLNKQHTMNTLYLHVGGYLTWQHLAFLH